MKRLTRLIAGALLTLGCGYPAVASSRGEPLPSVEEIESKLMGTLPKERGGLRTKGLRVRGIEIGSDDGAAAGSTTTKGAGLTVQEGSPYSESRIQFEFGSARLTPYAREVLDVFAKAIASPGLADRSFVVEGHTDGVGSDQFNLRLSRERADAVVDYLVSAWKADPGRFVTRGKGMRELLEKNDPRAASNRRVVWVALP